MRVYRKEGIPMLKVLAQLIAVSVTVGLFGAGLARAADDSKVKEGAKQTESGSRQLADGVVDTAKGIGKTVAGAAEVAGDKLKEAGDAAKPKAKSAWNSTRDGAMSFGRSVKTFFTRLVSNSPDEDTAAPRAR
jgi:hypothetical protein